MRSIKIRMALFRQKLTKDDVDEDGKQSDESGEEDEDNLKAQDQHINDLIDETN